MPEGTIVRVITRLDETCREVRDAARVIGDADLFTKMEEAQALIKRDSEWHSSVTVEAHTDCSSRICSQLGTSSCLPCPCAEVADICSIYSNHAYCHLQYCSTTHCMYTHHLATSQKLASWGRRRGALT